MFYSELFDYFNDGSQQANTELNQNIKLILSFIRGRRRINRGQQAKILLVCAGTFDK